MADKAVECGYCGGRAVKTGAGHVHADAGDRVRVGGPGDLVSARHNRAGTPILPVDLVDSGAVDSDGVGADYDPEAVYADAAEYMREVYGL